MQHKWHTRALSTYLHFNSNAGLKLPLQTVIFLVLLLLPDLHLGQLPLHGLHRLSSAISTPSTFSMPCFFLRWHLCNLQCVTWMSLHEHPCASTALKLGGIDMSPSTVQKGGKGGVWL